jgi:SsrA-binding protein
VALTVLFLCFIRATPRNGCSGILSENYLHVSQCALRKVGAAHLDLPGPIAYLQIIMAEKSDPNSKLIAENRRARFDYHIEDDIEAGIMLLGSEVKSLRKGGSNIAESYASVEGGELWLINGYIAPYLQAKTWGHEERRKRKLLVNAKELSRLWNATAREGMTIVPMKMYFNDKGIVKLKIGIAKGKKLADKRASEAKKDWDREKGRLLRQSTKMF